MKNNTLLFLSKRGLTLFLLLFCISIYAESNKSIKQHFSTAGYFSVDKSPRTTYNFNQGWRFYKGDIKGAEKEQFDDSKWLGVNLPDGMEILPENASGCRNYQGKSWYRKRFSVDRSKSDNRLFIYFEAVMGKSQVWINGKEVTSHYGGYLPFAVDITDVVRYDGKSNIISVLADNSDDTSYLPGKKQDGLDFSYFGGIYRDVYLISTSSLFVNLPQLSKKVAGGGVFVATTYAKDKSAELAVRTEIENRSGKVKSVQVKTILEDASYKVLKSETKKFSIAPNESKLIDQTLKSNNIHLWTPEDPYLNFVKTEVWENGQLKDCFRTRVGVKTIKMMGPKGLFVNSRPYTKKLIGANRHQDYVYVGNALPNSGQWRDVKLLREGGCNIIRAAHYPQDDAFYDACDEFGMFTTSANPGWHFFNFKEPIFEKRLYEDTHNLVRKDRNHCSILMWETALNETPQQPAHAMHNMHLAAHAEYPFDGMYTVTDIQEAKKAGLDIYYHGDDKNINSFTRECGDGGEVDNWYSHNAITRVKMEWGEKALLNQSEKLSATLASLNSTSPVRLGGALWAGMEHQRGYHPDPFWGGLMNLYRLPKYSYYLFRSQYPSDFKLEGTNINGPMLFIANELTQISPSDVYIYSNCDEVRLSFDGKVIATQKHSSDKKYKGLPNAPFVFKNAFDFKSIKKPGRNAAFKAEMVAEGLINGKLVVKETKLYPLRSEAIKLELDNQNMDLVADGSDFVPVRAVIVDVNGTKKVLSSEYVTFQVEGEGEIIGGRANNANPFKTQMGIATALIRSTTKPGIIKVKAYSDGLQPAELEITSVEPLSKECYDSKYASSSVKPDNDNLVIIKKVEAQKENATTEELEKKIKSLELQIVGKDQDIMELRSQLKNN